jgi:hypothetical protein
VLAQLAFAPGAKPDFRRPRAHHPSP